jgi:NAD+--asparagine ADP-ribosyltransferase
MIRNLIALALLALVLAPLVSMRQLGTIEARASVRVSTIGAVGTVSFDALVAATRL